MNFYAWTGLVNTITTTVVALFVWSRHQRDPRRITFIIFIASIAGWSFCYFLWQLATNASVALFLCRRALMVGCIVIPATFFHHIATLVNCQHMRPHRHIIQFGYCIALGLLMTSWSPWLVQRVAHRLSFPFWPVAGPLFYVYTAWFFAYVAGAITIMYTAFQRATGAQKGQLGCLLLGTLVAFAGGSTNFFLFFDIPIPPVGNVVVPFYVVLAALAAVRYQLMDIKIAVTRTGLLLMTYLLVLGLPFVVGWWGRGWLEARFQEFWWLIPLGLSTILATIGPFAYAYLRRQAEERLLKDQRRYQRMLQRAAQGMTRVRNLERLCELIVRVISRTVRVQHASLFLFEKGLRRYALVASRGPKRLVVQCQYALEADHALIRWLFDHRQVLSIEATSEPLAAVVRTELANLSAALIVPGFVEDELIGFLVLGQKSSGMGYSEDDLHAFSTLAHEAAIAIENARSYGDLAKANEHLRLAYDRLVKQERLVAAGQFATGMAHEIKNPLSAIKTFAEFLPEKYQDPAFREKFFRIVQSEIERIDGIVRALLNFAKPAPLQLESISVAALLDDTVTLLSNQFLKRGVDLHCTSTMNGLTIRADGQQLKQVMLNLLLNSLEATPSGGRVHVTASAEDDRCLIQVADTGCGMSEVHRQHLFDPFFTTKERGMGLGLAIVKGIVERHAGQIAVTSQPGQGTVVEVRLPCAPPAESGTHD